MQKLDPVKVLWIIRAKKNGVKNADVASSMKISVRWVQKLYSRYQISGTIPTLRKPGRPKRVITDQMKKTVQSTFEKFRCSAIFLEKILDADGIHIPHNTIHDILRSTGLAEEQPKKRRRRKWVRFERTYSNSMWHTDYKQHGFTILIQDESIFVDDVRLGKKYWVDANERMIVQWRGSHQKFMIYGMMSDNNQGFFRSYEKFNSVSFIDYLEEGRKKFGRIFVIVDRAPQHKSKKTR